MSYELITPKLFEKQLEALPKDVRLKAIEKILALAQEPRPSGVSKLKGGDDEYRIRVGDYRIRYEIDDIKKMIILLHCRHRREVYRM